MTDFSTEGHGRLVESAKDIARRLVEPLGRRWLHVRAASLRAEELRPAAGTHGDLLVAAAWLHDIGYSPEVADSGFHPLDGARYLASVGFPKRVVNLVAHHSGARFEATERGLATELSKFRLEDSPVMDALISADLTTGPDGQRLTYSQRIDEILSRYPVEDPVHRAWLVARDVLEPAIMRTEQRLRAAQPR